MSKIPVTIDIELEDLIPTFLNNREKDVVDIEEAMNKDDFHTVESIAHRIAGNAGSYGFNHLGELGKSMELAAKDSKKEQVSSDLGEMKEYLANIEITFEEID